MAKRTRRPIRGMGPVFADALQVPPHVREATGSEFVAAPTKRRRAASKRASTKGVPAIISLDDRSHAVSHTKPAFLSAGFDLGGDTAFTPMDRVVGRPNLGTKAAFDNDELVMVLPFEPGMGFLAGLEAALDMSVEGPATEEEMAGLLRTLARGRNEPDDMSGVMRTLSRGQ